MLPPTFGIVVDEWTRFREHYYAIYVVYTDANDNVQEILLSCGVQEEDEDSDSMDFTADSIGDYIYDELQEALEFFGVLPQEESYQGRHHQGHNSLDQRSVRRNKANTQEVNPTE